MKERVEEEEEEEFGIWEVKMNRTFQANVNFLQNKNKSERSPFLYFHLS